MNDTEILDAMKSGMLASKSLSTATHQASISAILQPYLDYIETERAKQEPEQSYAKLLEKLADAQAAYKAINDRVYGPGGESHELEKVRDKLEKSKENCNYWRLMAQQRLDHDRRMDKVREALVQERDEIAKQLDNVKSDLFAANVRLTAATTAALGYEVEIKRSERAWSPTLEAILDLQADHKMKLEKLQQDVLYWQGKATAPCTTQVMAQGKQYTYHTGASCAKDVPRETDAQATDGVIPPSAETLKKLADAEAYAKTYAADAPIDRPREPMCDCVMYDGWHYPYCPVFKETAPQTPVCDCGGVKGWHHITCPEFQATVPYPPSQMVKDMMLKGYIDDRLNSKDQIAADIITEHYKRAADIINVDYDTWMKSQHNPPRFNWPQRDWDWRPRRG